MYILINITSLHKYSHHCIYSSIVTNPLFTCTLCLFHIVNTVYILINIIYNASLACIISSNIAWLVGEGGGKHTIVSLFVDSLTDGMFFPSFAICCNWNSCYSYMIFKYCFCCPLSMFLYCSHLPLLLHLLVWFNMYTNSVSLKLLVNLVICIEYWSLLRGIILKSKEIECFGSYVFCLLFNKEYSGGFFSFFRIFSFFSFS